MRQILQTLWSDDRGTIIATEYLFFATIVIIGTIVGMANVRDAINVELSELANSYLALSQAYTISGTSGGSSSTGGSMTISQSQNVTLQSVPPASVSNIFVPLPGS